MRWLTSLHWRATIEIDQKYCAFPWISEQDRGSRHWAINYLEQNYDILADCSANPLDLNRIELPSAMQKPDVPMAESESTGCAKNFRCSCDLGISSRGNPSQIPMAMCDGLISRVLSALKPSAGRDRKTQNSWYAVLHNREGQHLQRIDAMVAGLGRRELTAQQTSRSSQLRTD
jgi:hypothetical protein